MGYSGPEIGLAKIRVDQLSNYSATADAIAEKCEYLEKRHAHWYEIARLRALAASAAALSGRSEEDAVVARGLEAARRCGRTEWISVIQSAATQPIVLLQLLVR